MEDESEIYDGIRAKFPLSFGKQTKSQAPLEQIHNSTRRSINSSTAAAAAAASSSESKASSKTKKNDNPFLSISSSSKAWLASLKTPNRHSSLQNDVEVGPPRPPPEARSDFDEDEDSVIGPPPPPTGQDGEKGEEEEDGVAMIGPPRPRQTGEEEEEDDGPLIGPPRPPPGSVESDSEDDELDDGDEANQYRIPLSNEIVLKDHTKVLSSGFLRLCN